VEDRAENPLPLIRLMARVEPEWLIDLFPEHVREENKVMWNRQAERVDVISQLLYDELILQESNGAASDAEAAAALLAEKALEAGMERFIDAEMLEQWLGRLEFAGFTAPDIPEAFKDFCRGYRSFADLKGVASGFFQRIEQKLDAHRLRELAPLTRACRISSACVRRRGSVRSKRLSFFICLRPTDSRCKLRRTWRGFGRGFTQRCAAT
jgi:ATP-dependent helicase HrpB